VNKALRFLTGEYTGDAIDPPAGFKSCGAECEAAYYERELVNYKEEQCSLIRERHQRGPDLFTA
jgi:hypothetical protein